MIEENRVAVVGCGGLGVPAAWTLALGGARRLRLIDADAVELSNLHRQVLYTTQDLGQSKGQVLAAALHARVAGLDIEVAHARLDRENCETMLSGCCAVVEGTDDAASKFVVNDWAVAQRHRYASIAAAIGRRGQWMVIAPQTACYRCIFEEPPPSESLATCQVAGVLGPVVGLVGSLAARSLQQSLRDQADPAIGALVRWSPRGLLRTPVQIAANCLCQQGK